MNMISFPALLRTLRTRARLSQLALSEQAALSQRQISFLETGRSKPSRASVLKLAKALTLSPSATNHLLGSAGYTDAYQPPSWDSESMAPIRMASGHILRSHLPYPAILLSAGGDVIEANAAFDHVLSLIGDPATLWARTHGSRNRNLYRLSLHADGLAPHMVNFEEVARATLQRAAREAIHQPQLSADISEFISWPHIDPAWLNTAWEPLPGPVIEERYTVRGTVVSLFAVVSTLGAPIDIALGSARVESYFPADERSRQLILSATRHLRRTADSPVITPSRH